MVTVVQLEKTNRKIILYRVRQAKRDIKIKDEKMMMIRSEQLKDLRWKEKKIQKRGGPVKRSDRPSPNRKANGRALISKPIKCHLNSNAGESPLLIHRTETTEEIATSHITILIAMP